MSDPIKNFGNVKPFYELLRDVNPHLPDPELVTTDTITLTAGPNELAALNLTVFITLPDLERINESLHVQNDADDFEAWSLDGTVTTVHRTRINKEELDV